MERRHVKRLGICVLAAVLPLAACERVEDVPEAAVRDDAADHAAHADAGPVEVQLFDAAGAQVGVAHLTQTDGGVEIHVRVSGLAPGTEHGIHFHQNGVCEPPSFASAGAHFNPANAQHGLENPQGPHAGDMPNIRAGDDGVAEATFTQTYMVLRGGEMALQQPNGIALIVHADRDDQVTDPSGNSGDRIACGVVQVP